MGWPPYKSAINPRYLQFASKGKPTVKAGQPRTAPKTAQLSLVKVQSEPHLHTHGFKIDRLTLASSLWKILQIQVVTISTQIGSLKKSYYSGFNIKMNGDELTVSYHNMMCFQGINWRSSIFFRHIPNEPFKAFVPCIFSMYFTLFLWQCHVSFR